MRVGNVIATVEIVIHVHFPVAIQGVNAAVKIFQFLGEPQRRDKSRNRPEKIPQRRRAPIQVHKYKILPGIDLHGDEAIVLAFEILYAVEFGHAFERTIEAVVPSVIRTMQDGGLSAGLGHDGCRVMTAHVVEGAQDAVVSAHRYQRLIRYCCGHKLSGLFHLIDSADHLPRFAENSLPFQFRNARVHVPRSGNRVSIGQWRFVVVSGENLIDGRIGDHAFFPVV